MGNGFSDEDLPCLVPVGDLSARVAVHMAQVAVQQEVALQDLVEVLRQKCEMVIHQGLVVGPQDLAERMHSLAARPASLGKLLALMWEVQMAVLAVLKAWMWEVQMAGLEVQTALWEVQMALLEALMVLKAVVPLVLEACLVLVAALSVQEVALLVREVVLQVRVAGWQVLITLVLLVRVVGRLVQAVGLQDQAEAQLDPTVCTLLVDRLQVLAAGLPVPVVVLQGLAVDQRVQVVDQRVLLVLAVCGLLVLGVLQRPTHSVLVLVPFQDLMVVDLLVRVADHMAPPVLEVLQHLVLSLALLQRLVLSLALLARVVDRMGLPVLEVLQPLVLSSAPLARVVDRMGPLVLEVLQPLVLSLAPLAQVVDRMGLLVLQV
ncbi:hypothetical protein AK812_SmicGene26074 [Symbiodinium microadriaticum]|uniref:Uncharacterized protein n=1 Tax=Symbiodinium microadriaticum TaxID=2951 RepID=A0A1Q9DAK7_SYMMI|nr:hypothetical protein AK812_SmicGene26074 [Symbiodinium microadriaticum]